MTHQADSLTGSEEIPLTPYQHPECTEQGPSSRPEHENADSNPTESSLTSARIPGVSSNLRWWLPEIFASILSVASIISMVVIFCKYDGRALDNLNLPNGLTLNGIVAAISTLNRVCLMVPVGTAISQEAWLWFSGAQQQQICRSRLGDLDLSDAASRGSWGSLIFLCHLTPRRLLASLGAIISIMSLGFGTFTQQILAIDNIAVTDVTSSLSPGNIPRSETWANVTGNMIQGVGAFGPLLNMKAAILNAVLTAGIEPITAACPSGNCTWPGTSSLAVCGGCVPSTYTTQCFQSTDVEEPDICNYTLPSGSVVTLTDFARTSWGTGFVSSPSNGAHFNSTLKDRLYLANFDVFGAPYGSLADKPWPNSSTISSECALWMCVQSYNTMVQAGKQVQTINSTSSKISVAPSPLQTEWVLEPLPVDTAMAPQSNFTVFTQAAEGLAVYLYPVLNGSIDLQIQTLTPSTNTIEGIWNGTSNIDAWIQNLALSMTNVVRTGAPLSRREYDGTGYQLGITVRWEWIALPAAMVLLSIGLLVAIIIQTARSPVEAWKSSPLALLLCDVEQEVKCKVHGQMNKYGGIEKAVGKKKVSLTGTGEGTWMFQAV